MPELVVGRRGWRPFRPLGGLGEMIGKNGVGSPVDPYRLGDTMSTRTIAIAALAIAVVIVVVLFVL